MLPSFQMAVGSNRGMGLVELAQVVGRLGQRARRIVLEEKMKSWRWTQR